MHIKKHFLNITLVLILLTVLLPYISFGATTIPNPLGSDKIEDFVQQLMSVIVKVGSAVSVIFLIYSGYLFVEARGNEGKVTKARETFTWTIVGIGILLGASLIATLVIGTITAIRS